MNDAEANIDNEGDEVMEDFEAIEGQPEVHGVSNQLTKSLSITRAGSSKSSDVLSDSASQEALPEVISIFVIYIAKILCCSLTVVVLTGSEAQWSHQCMHGCWERYALLIWRNDGSER